MLSRRTEQEQLQLIDILNGWGAAPIYLTGTVSGYILTIYSLRLNTVLITENVINVSDPFFCRNVITWLKKK